MLQREFLVFAKPAGPVCNYNCSYCYYSGHTQLFGNQDTFQMSDEILKKYIIDNIEATTDPVINFAWHGGEPTLAGIDFFRKAVQWQTQYKPLEKTIINGIQTNGSLIDDTWCRFLAENNFIVGISIDGSENLHNIYRTTRNNLPTFQKTMQGFERLMKHHIIPEILCVVSAANVSYPLEVFRFFKNLGVNNITFLPLVEPEPGNSSGVSEHSVPSEDFGIFLSTIFDEWMENDIESIKVQIFEEALRAAFHQDHSLCIFKTVCGGVPVLEQNGNLYPCDHYVSPRYYAGNIKEISLASFLDSEAQKAFGRVKSDSLPAYCIKCEVKAMCNGECPKNRLILTPDGEPGLNYLCEGYKHFFNHCKPFIEAVALTWQNQ